jgi:uncharacterized membrane protein
MSYQTPEAFNRRVVEPIECIKTGWATIKDQYWLFVGITLVGILISGAVPFVLVGPMMCGIFLCIFQKVRGEPVDFGALFKGFDFFGPSLIATILHVIPMIVIILPFYLLMFVVPMLMIGMQQDGEPNPAMPILFVLILGFFMVVMAVLMMVVNIAFTFVYPLIAERKLSGLDAVKLSARAGLANFWRLLGLMLLCGLMGFAGVLMCYVGLFLVLPITFSSMAVAYRQVFGLGNVRTNVPPPPPVFS